MGNPNPIGILCSYYNDRKIHHLNLDEMKKYLEYNLVKLTYEEIEKHKQINRKANKEY